MNILEKHTFLSGDIQLAGTIMKPEKAMDEVGILILHGGGKANKDRFSVLQNFLAENGFISLAFDFRGVGESQGKFVEGRLKNRLIDAQAAYDFLSQYAQSIIVIGCSMGGHVAARLTEKRHIDAIILLYAAAYAAEAEDKPLNEEFTTVLRRENSWQNSPAFAAVKQYNGRILIMYGENDTIVPKEVQSVYKKLTSQKGKFIILPHASHLFLNPHSEEEKKMAERAYDEIQIFLADIHV